MYFSIFVNISFEVAMCFDINVDELWEKPSYKIHAKIIIIVHYDGGRKILLRRT